MKIVGHLFNASSLCIFNYYDLYVYKDASNFLWVAQGLEYIIIKIQSGVF